VTFAVPPIANKLFIEVTIENTGSAPHTFVADNQWLQDKDGRLFAPDKAWYADGSHDPEHSEFTRIDLNPGVGVQKIAIEFEVPNGTHLNQYMLAVHAASPYSTGPKIGLRQFLEGEAIGH
jgi:hypothetical protein